MKIPATLTAWSLAFCLAAPAFADLSIEEMLVRKKGPDANLRVVIVNPGTTSQAGPITITLFVRRGPKAEWQQVKVWNDVPNLAAGNKVARDYFEENNATVRELARSPRFEAKAVVQAPGVGPVEKVGTFHPGEGTDTK